MLSKLARLSAGVLIVLTIVVYSQAIIQDRLLVHVLNFDKLNQDKYQKILNGLPYYQHIEKVAVSLYNFQVNNNQINCDQISEWGNKLIEINKRNTQGYYILTACAEREGNEKKAIQLIETAIKYDPLNTQYLLGAAILHLNVGNLSVSESYLNKVKIIDAKTYNLDKITILLANKKLEVNTETTASK